MRTTGKKSRPEQMVLYGDYVVEKCVRVFKKISSVMETRYELPSVSLI